jgi:phage-related baseplate assembly protein
MSDGLLPPPEYGLDQVPDIDFAVTDPTTIENDVIVAYQVAFLALTGIAKNLAPADPVRLHLLVVCNWLSQQRSIIDFTGKQNLLKYATGAYLDNLAALLGQRTLRLPAAAATTTLQFTLGAALPFDAVIPAGTQVQAPNSIIFATDADGILPAGSTVVAVTATASLTGSLGNGFTPGQVGSLVNWNQAFAVSVTNTTTTAGGSDAESDDRYRYRIWLAIESFSTCGPEQAYEFWALSADPDIIQCVVYSAPEIAGEVWLYPLLSGGVVPTDDILTLVEAACSDSTRRPVTDFVTAYAPTLVTYTLDITYYIVSENEVLFATIQAAVEQAVADWILWQRSFISRDLNGDELIKRCLEAGAKRIVINSPSPSYVVRAYNELAVHDPDVDPVITFGGYEDQ